jgi:hypothetical protein
LQSPYSSLQWFYSTGGGDYIGSRASGGPVWPGTWLVGEKGPELLSLGSSGHVYDNNVTTSLFDSKQDMKELIDEVIRLRKEVTYMKEQVTTNTNQTVKYLERWEFGGMPETRT